MLFSEVIGQKVLKGRILSALSEGRVSHAQLFLGPEGSGSLPLALAYAQYLVCRSPKADDACGQCDSCIKAAKMVHPDITFSFPVVSKEKISKPKSVDFINEFREAVLANPYMNYQEWTRALAVENKQGLINIEEARNIIQRLSMKAVEGSFRVVLMWYPEKMNTEAANCLLKILEEPEEKTVFLLVAENDEPIPQTILSRTQLVKLNRLTDEEVYKGISSIGEAEPKILQAVARRAEGNYLAALQFMEDTDPDSDLAERFLDWMRACLKMNVEKLQQLGDELASVGRERQKAFFEYSLSIVRDCLLLNYGDERLVRITGKDLDNFRKFAPFIHKDNAGGFITSFNDAHYHVERNANFKILFMDLSFRLYRLLHAKN